ncbi:hypothetical protein BDR22DRAFT_68972 [Usnea florida]
MLLSFYHTELYPVQKGMCVYVKRYISRIPSHFDTMPPLIPCGTGVPVFDIYTSFMCVSMHPRPQKRKRERARESERARDWIVISTHPSIHLAASLLSSWGWGFQLNPSFLPFPSSSPPTLFFISISISSPLLSSSLPTSSILSSSHPLPTTQPPSFPSSPPPTQPHHHPSDNLAANSRSTPTPTPTPNHARAMGTKVYLLSLFTIMRAREG